MDVGDTWWKNQSLHSRPHYGLLFHRSFLRKKIQDQQKIIAQHVFASEWAKDAAETKVGNCIRGSHRPRGDPVILGRASVFGPLRAGDWGPSGRLLRLRHITDWFLGSVRLGLFWLSLLSYGTHRLASFCVSSRKIQALSRRRIPDSAS